MYIPTSQVVREVLRVREWLRIPLNKEHPLVLEWAGPVSVDLQMSSTILRDDHVLGLIWS